MPASSADDALGPARAGFELLRARFVAGLEERARAITSGPLDARIAAAHRLVGAAGSFGFAALGERARAVEQALAGPSRQERESSLERLLEAIVETTGAAGADYDTVDDRSGRRDTKP